MKNKINYEQEINKLIFPFLNSIGDDKLLYYLQCSFEDDIFDLDADIQNELNHANFAKKQCYLNEARTAIKASKHLTNLKNEYQKLFPLLKEIVKTRKKIKKLKE